jgi:hypothetical protein
VAVALVALYTIDDGFVHPQPGVGAGEHVVSALVPLAVLALAGWAHSRRRPGARATPALVVGALAPAPAPSTASRTRRPAA